jgi:hypothetical protein
VSSALRTIATYGDRLELELARARLSAAGIRAFATDEHTSTLNPHYLTALGGHSLKVREEDEAAALEILREPEGDRDDEDDDEDDDEPRCPRCASRYAYFERSPLVLFLSFFLLGLPLLFSKKRWHCKKCDTTFRAPAPADDPLGPYRRPRRGARRYPSVERS